MGVSEYYTVRAALRAYKAAYAWAVCSGSRFEVLGRPELPMATVQAKAIIKHDRILTGRD